MQTLVSWTKLTLLFATPLLITMAISQAAYAISRAQDYSTLSMPTPNPYLADSSSAITHFDSAQTDSMPYGPPLGVYKVDPKIEQVVPGGPVNIITLGSTDSNYMWEVGTDRVSYVYKAGGQWNTVAKYEALAEATGGAYPALPDANLLAFGQSSAVGMTTTTMDSQLIDLFGNNYSNRLGNGSYVVVDKDNVLYANYANSIYGFALKDSSQPSAGIYLRYKIDNVINSIEGNSPAPPAGTRITGLSMSYDGHIIVTFTNGVGAIDRNLNPASKSFYRFGDDEYVSNSIAVDEKNGIYVASDKLMRKLFWTGTTLSDKAADGAWSSTYDHSTELPPIIKFGTGTGSTPTLMGFGNDPDKLVVITDGSKQMNLVAFWRDNIPNDFMQKAGTPSRRVADQIPVTCGFPKLPEWIQSEQSVVVSGYGAFVVNNIPETVSSEIKNANKFLQVALMGPAYLSSFGTERFAWDKAAHQWSSAWARPDVSSTSMIPAHSQIDGMVLVNGYTSANGWEVTGLDWQTGATAHQTIFGQANFGNGAYAILQAFDNGDLLFNSIAGPVRVNYGN
ncbi:MAG: hypothetical protein HY794_14820 [Desulfarculus sp.]|nr:hypothetical protein [Desulfarculus sp.]